MRGPDIKRRGFWETKEYLGGGFVLQRLMIKEQSEEPRPALKYTSSADETWYKDLDEDPYEDEFVMNIEQPERVIHVTDSENIDNSAILKYADSDE